MQPCLKAKDCVSGVPRRQKRCGTPQIRALASISAGIGAEPASDFLPYMSRILSSRNSRNRERFSDYFPGWMKENPARDVDRMALDTVRKPGMTPVEVHIPDWLSQHTNCIFYSARYKAWFAGV
jgi:hypothetical protein